MNVYIYFNILKTKFLKMYKYNPVLPLQTFSVAGKYQNDNKGTGKLHIMAMFLGPV